MRTFATLATLFVGLAFVFWAPTAKADCPHKGANFDHPLCGGGEPPPPDGASLILVDSDDPSKEVGVVVNIARANALVAVTLDGENYLLSATVSTLGNLGTVLFPNTTCTEPGYLDLTAITWPWPSIMNSHESYARIWCLNI